MSHKCALIVLPRMLCWSGELQLFARVAIARLDPRALVGAPAGPVYLPPATDHNASGLLVLSPDGWVPSVRFGLLARQVSRAALRQVGAACLSAAATTSIVVAAVNYDAGRQAVEIDHPIFDRQVHDQVTSIDRQVDQPSGFAERWGQAEFVPSLSDASDAYASASLQTPVKTIRFAKPVVEDDPATTASVSPRPRFPVAYSLASLDAKQVDIDKPDLLGKQAAGLDEVSQYLWEVYQRSPTKKDGTGDFTWKDPAAAKRVGMPLPKYVIGGMDPDFREQLYHAGRAMDAAGVKWVILSAFRDDYRQRIAAGIKAAARNSLHGGSLATGGYGHGRAVDVTGGEDESNAVWRWLDANGAKYGLHRPMPGYDPGHVQSRGDWRKLAASLRKSRIKAAQEASAPVATRVAASASR